MTNSLATVGMLNGEIPNGGGAKQPLALWTYQFATFFRLITKETFEFVVVVVESFGFPTRLWRTSRAGFRRI